MAVPMQQERHNQVCLLRYKKDHNELAVFCGPKMVALATATAVQQDSGRNVMTTLKKVTIKLQVTGCLLGCSSGAIGNSC